MNHRQKIAFGLLITIVFLITGTAGYATIEHYSLLDAFYMTVITITTVGFGEVHTLSESGRIFTIFLILFGFGSIGFLAHAFTEAIVERAARGDLGKKTMQKRIKQLRNHVIICGYGRVGEAAAEHLASTGSDFVVIETQEAQLKIIEENHFNYLEGDATREDTLLAAGIKKADALLALLDSDPDNLFTVLTARELNPTLHIIARTETATSESRMLRAGADSIISPYATAGRSVAEKILSLALENEAEIPPEAIHDTGPHWVDVGEQPDLAGHVVETASAFLNANIIGIRRDDKDILLPHHEEQILPDDILLTTHICHLDDHSICARKVQKIILIDDNPVIRRLYTRLFQKAGFHLLTSQNGADGYMKIISEKPDAAIIDLELPDISGLDICKRLRDDENLKEMKIFLFTGHEDKETRQAAIEAGVDTVVIKSPEATEIVNTVKQRLQRT